MPSPRSRADADFLIEPEALLRDRGGAIVIGCDEIVSAGAQNRLLLPDVRDGIGSWHEWSARSDLPLEVRPC